MRAILRFLRILLLEVPREILLALLLTVVLLVLIPILLLLLLWRWLLGMLRGRSLFQEDKERPCGRLPEAIIRRPDPCIYSQRLLQSQGLPVTWNNPDIWLARADDPANIEPDSYHLVEDTDYIVSVQVHNASATDPAIGVRVRLSYRPWSFNSPDLVPVEVDAGGNEVFRFVNVAPMGAAVAQFTWHTPALEPGQQKRHFCLQASLYHPMDLNTANNMGQENADVHAANPGAVAPGEEVEITIPLVNLGRRPQRFRFQAGLYQVDTRETFELELHTVHGYAHMTATQKVANFVPRLHVKPPPVTTAVARGERAEGSRFAFENRRRLRLAKSRYEGFAGIAKAVKAQARELPPGMVITAAGEPLGEGIHLEAGAAADVPFRVTIPGDAAPGMRYPVNILALHDNGVLAGGVTVVFDVEGGQ